MRTSPSASVTVDGVARGTTPVAVYDLDWGAHTVIVSRAGYAPETRRVLMSPEQPAASVTVDLRAEAAATARARRDVSASPPSSAGAPRPVESPGATTVAAGQMHLLTRPAGAQVFIDGRPAGTTPALLTSVSSGSRTVRFELAGYRPWQTTVDVMPGRRVRVAASLERGR